MTEHTFGTLSDIDLEKLTPVIVGDENAPSAVLEESEEPAEQPAEETTESEESTEEVVEKTEETTLPDLETEDWMSKLAPEEVFNSAKGAAPRLMGLRRIARPYIKREESRVNALVVIPREIIRPVQTLNSNGDVMSTSEEIGRHHYPMASVTFFIDDIYGRTYSDSADAYYSNCNELGHFPTAVASARAEARALRKLLGISQHSAEELSDKDASEELAPDDDAPAKPEQVKLIDKILGGLNEFSLKDLIEGITTREIYSVDEFTTGEARRALRILNDEKKKSKRKNKK